MNTSNVRSDMSDALKARAITDIEKHSLELSKVSDQIWSNPELCFTEYKAHALLTEFLENKGFRVDRSYLGIQTAFRASFGDSNTGPNICVICEYDALPEIGHACGHNLIAEAGLAAALGIKAALEAQGAPKGTLIVMGTPAEEGGGGKIKLIKRNAFDTIDIAMMVHPTPYNMVKFTCLALKQIQVNFHGKAAHAAAFPWDGVNALDAAVIAYNNISLLRQQMKSTWRVHGIIANGGSKPNIIPELTKMDYYIRAPTKAELEELYTKVMACFDAAAKATGCTLEVPEDFPLYENVLTNPVMSDLYEANSTTLGIKFTETTIPCGSTDMGNVSHVVPSIHPFYSVGDTSQVNHTREFTAVCNTPAAHNNTLTAAKALAMTAIDVLCTPGLLEQIKEAFHNN